jgi:uncharacterized membrane protein YjjP (DUF1212 family)
VSFAHFERLAKPGEPSKAAVIPTDFEARARFVASLAKRLHEAGTTAARLEDALDKVGQKLQLHCNVWSSPTAIIMSCADVRDPQRKTIDVLRLQPGDIDLRTLCAVDRIAEQVTSGELNIDSGERALVLAAAPVSTRRAWIETLSGFTLANFGVSCLLKLSWIEIGLAALVGFVLGLLHATLGTKRRFAQGMETICAIVAALILMAAAHYVAPINYRACLLSSLIVLVPGMGITSAAAEIALGHLVSGTARMAGAFATLLKLSFGALVGGELGNLLGFAPLAGSLAPAPTWVPWFGLLVSGVSFAVLFKAPARAFPLAIGAALLGYSCTRAGGYIYGAEFGVFFAGLIVTLVANFYARRFRRPGALIRLPGIILLVPGSVGFKSLAFVIEKDVFLGLDAAVSMLLLVVSLVAGILFASTLVPPRDPL